MPNLGRPIHLLLIGDETMAAMFAVKGVYSADEGADPWVGVARILEERLNLDLTDPANAGIGIKINNEDFSYLAPQPQHGVYTTISSLLEIYDSNRAGWDELHFEVQYRYGMLSGSIGNLMFSLVDAEQRRMAKAAGAGPDTAVQSRGRKASVRRRVTLL